MSMIWTVVPMICTMYGYGLRYTQNTQHTLQFSSVDNDSVYHGSNIPPQALTALGSEAQGQEGGPRFFQTSFLIQISNGRSRQRIVVVVEQKPSLLRRAGYFR